MRAIETVVIVCVDCERDLVWVNVVPDQEGRPVLDGWASRWFGCDCIGRKRLVRDDTWEIVHRGAGAHERIEPYGPVEEPATT